jgi:DNA-binding SARP family transcriptional activator
VGVQNFDAHPVDRLDLTPRRVGSNICAAGNVFPKGAAMPRATATAAKAALPFRLCLLGSFRLERDSQPVRLPTRKVESLLAYLVLFPEQHPREKLAALFWGDVPDLLARGSLRKALTFIRIHLGNAILFSDREMVQLNPRYLLWTDAREFIKLADLEKTSSPSQSDTENLQAAIDLYQDDLLVDCYDDWILSERERYRVFYVEILLRLTQHMRAPGLQTRRSW